MIAKRFFTPLLIGIAVSAQATVMHVRDTTVKTTLIITPRVNSTGHFPFTGALINHNLNADLNLFMERKGVGFFLFKSHDLQEKHSIINYLQPGVFATARLTSKLRARLFFGYLFSQVNSFRDADSDYYTAVTLYWHLTKNLRLENTALFYDVRQQVKLADRLLLTWQVKKIKLDLYVWQRIVLEENNHATSAMFAVTFPQLKFSDSVSVLITSSYQRYLTQNKPGFALRNGFLFSLSVPVDLSY